MTRGIIGAAVLAGLLACPCAGLAAPILKPCPPRWGKPAAPLVPDERTATAIFLAVEPVISPRADRRNYPRVIAEDDGEAWAVFRTASARHGGGRSFGGGQLEMRIAKCDAAISEVHFSK
jgi:hypothetical protein